MNSTSCPPLCLLLGIQLQDPLGWGVLRLCYLWLPLPVKTHLGEAALMAGWVDTVTGGREISPPRFSSANVAANHATVLMG